MAECTCGASGDTGELVEHCVSKLLYPDRQVDHAFIGESEPTAVVEARARAARRLEVLTRLGEATGATIEEIRDALNA